MKRTLLAITGAVAGALLGYFATGWAASQGFYSILLPGLFAGVGSLLGTFKNKFLMPGVIGVCVVILTYFTEWRYFPFSRDHSFSFFVEHLGDLRPMTHIMAIGGGLISFLLPFNRSREASGRKA